MEGGDFTKESYSGVQSDRFGGRIVGLERESDDAKIAFGGVDKGGFTCGLGDGIGVIKSRADKGRKGG